MLISFSANNFKSINNSVELNLRAGSRLRKKKHHVSSPTGDKSLKVLKSTVLFGANASGKSNIFKAMAFLKDMLLKPGAPTSRVNYESFKLIDKKNDKLEITSLYIEFVIYQLHLGYGISFDHERIHEESLFIYEGDNQIPLFERNFDGSKYSIDISDSAFFRVKDDSDSSDIKDNESNIIKDIESLTYLNNFTPKNRLFLAECIERNAFEQHSNFIGVLVSNWFKFYLTLIFPDTKYGGLVRDLKKRDDSQVKELNDCSYLGILKEFDTGIDDVQLKQVDISSFESELFIKAKKELVDSGKDKASFINEGTQYQLEMTNEGEFNLFKIVTLHKLNSGKYVELSLLEESDGTKRLLDLAPILTNNHGDDQASTYLIDEFDRSLHPNLSKAFFNHFLNGTDTESSNNQLIVTTHEAELLDNSLIRRDEIWFVQKERDKATTLYSLNDYSTRFDKDIHKAYLQGIFGAVPNIHSKLNGI